MSAILFSFNENINDTLEYWSSKPLIRKGSWDGGKLQSIWSRPSGFKFCHWLVVWPWLSPFKLSVPQLISKNGIIIVVISQFTVRLKSVCVCMCVYVSYIYIYVCMCVCIYIYIKCFKQWLLISYVCVRLKKKTLFYHGFFFFFFIKPKLKGWGGAMI